MPQAPRVAANPGGDLATAEPQARRISRSGCACAHEVAHPPPKEAAGSGPSVGRSGYSRALSILSATALVLMPKCPFCLVGWMGALGLGGLSAHATAIPVALLVVFCASQAVFFTTARRTGDRRALLCAALGVALVAGAYFLDAPSLVRWLGVALLVGASVLNALAMAKARRHLVERVPGWRQRNGNRRQRWRQLPPTSASSAAPP
jgi:hypothetical protein